MDVSGAQKTDKITLPVAITSFRTTIYFEPRRLGPAARSSI